jgi:DHA1 family tetracycline resistance protein-like MFS transporter
VVQAVLIRLAARYLGDIKTVKLGLMIQIPTLAMIALVDSGALLLALTPLAALGSIGTPALQAIMSRAVDAESQGALQGVLASLNAFATMLALLGMTQVFAYFSGSGAIIYLPGAPFLMSALLMAIGLGLFGRLHLSTKS